MKSFCNNFYLYNPCCCISSGYFLEGFVGRLFREFGVVIGAAVLVSAFVSLTLTPMLNAYLMKGGEQKKLNSIILPNLYFKN